MCAGWLLTSNGDIGVCCLVVDQQWGDGSVCVCLLFADHPWTHGCVLVGC